MGHATGIFDLLTSRLRRTRVAVTGNLRTRFSQRKRDGGAQPGRCTGNQSDTVLQFELIENQICVICGFRKSSRRGEKISIKTTSSSIIVAPCQQFDGKCSTSPADAICSLPSMKNRTRPRSTIVICSCG